MADAGNVEFVAFAGAHVGDETSNLGRAHVEGGDGARLDMGNAPAARLLIEEQIEDAIGATAASIKAYEELERISTQYVAEQVVLKSELMEVQSKLAQEKLSLLKLQDKQATAKETLNNLARCDMT